MTREIKFRAWDEKRKTMWGVDCLNWYDEYMWVNESPMSGDKLPIESTPLMQYTGLKDKNGKEISKGDIFTQDAYYVLYDCPSTYRKYMSGVEPCQAVSEAMGWKHYIDPELWKRSVPLLNES